MVRLLPRDRLSSAIALLTQSAYPKVYPLGQRGETPQSRFALFAQKDENGGTSSQFEEDEPILGFQQINDTLDDAESKYTTLLTANIQRQVNTWWKSIESHLDSLDEKSIDKKPLNMSSGIQGILLKGWQEIFSTGAKDGVSEVNELVLAEKENSPTGLFNDCHNLLVEFDVSRRRNRTNFDYLANTNSLGDRFDNLTQFATVDRSGTDKFIKRKPAFEVAYPPDQADLDVLTIDELREALNLRTQVLAEDLSQEVSDKIARVIKDSVDLHFVQGQEVQRLPLAARTKIRNQINGIIGYERQKQKSRGVTPQDLPRTEIEIPGVKDSQGKPVVVRRAKMIASTELNAGYNLGRIQSYYRAGVTSVRWQAIGDNRTCEICLSRNGAVLPIDEVLRLGIAVGRSGSKNDKYRASEYVIPAHPFCRCAWQVATKDEAKDELRGVAKVVKPKPLAKSWQKIGSAASLISGIGTAGTIINAAARKTRERQLQEKAQKKARNRAIGAAAGALSLGALSLGLWSWLNRSKNIPVSQALEPLKTAEALKPQRSKLIAESLSSLVNDEAQSQAIGSALLKSQGELARARQKREQELKQTPLTPVTLLRGRNLQDLGWNEVKQRKYAAFINSGVDLKTASDLQLRSDYGLSAADIAIVRDLGRKFQQDLVKTSPFEKLMPAAVISPLWLIKYPWLADVKDLRTLSLAKMRSKGINESDALIIYNNIYGKSRSAAGIARVSPEERKILNRINSLQTKEELAGLLQLPRNQTEIVNSLYTKLQQYRSEGKEIKSLTELRIKGVGDATIARLLASAKGQIKINELFLSGDRSLILARLQTITGVGKKTAEVIYESLLYTGTQFLGAYDMINRIEPLLNAKGQKLSAVAKKSIYNRLDFTYYPGFDRQAIPPTTDFPGLPELERRGDDRPVTTNTGLPGKTNPEAKPVSGNTERQVVKWNGAKVSMATNLVFASEIKLKTTLAKEIKNIKVEPGSAQTIGESLRKTEQKVSQLLEKYNTKAVTEQRKEISSLIDNTDKAIASLTEQLEATGVRVDSIQRGQIAANLNQLESTIAFLDQKSALSVWDRTQLDKFKNGLTDLRERAYEAEVLIKNNPLSEGTKALSKAMLNTQKLIEELEAVSPSVVPPAYPLKQNLQLLKLTQQRLINLPNPVVEQIQGLLQQINDLDGGDRNLLNTLLTQRRLLLEISDRYL